MCFEVRMKNFIIQNIFIIVTKLSLGSVRDQKTVSGGPAEEENEATEAELWFLVLKSDFKFCVK